MLPSDTSAARTDADALALTRTHAAAPSSVDAARCHGRERWVWARTAPVWVWGGERRERLHRRRYDGLAAGPTPEPAPAAATAAATRRQHRPPHTPWPQKANAEFAAEQVRVVLAARASGEDRRGGRKHEHETETTGAGNRAAPRAHPELRPKRRAATPRPRPRLIVSSVSRCARGVATVATAAACGGGDHGGVTWPRGGPSAVADAACPSRPQRLRVPAPTSAVPQGRGLILQGDQAGPDQCGAVQQPKCRAAQAEEGHQGSGGRGGVHQAAARMGKGLLPKGRGDGGLRPYR
eukprot:357752-Chlamydomonas_euryale.AAC.2